MYSVQASIYYPPGRTQCVDCTPSTMHTNETNGESPDLKPWSPVAGSTTVSTAPVPSPRSQLLRMLEVAEARHSSNLHNTEEPSPPIYSTVRRTTMTDAVSSPNY